MQDIPATLNLENDIVLDPREFGSENHPSKQRLVQEYLDVLKSDTSKLLRKDDERYSIAFDRMREQLRRKVLDAVIREKFGSASCRLMKILSEHGKLDDKQVREWKDVERV